MKNKRPNKTNVYRIDQKFQSHNEKHETNENKLCEGKIINFMTICSACEKRITKKNKKGDFYLCEECVDLTPPEIYVKITNSIERDLLKEVPTYVNWDEEDLDYLYYTFWNEEDSPPND